MTTTIERIAHQRSTQPMARHALGAHCRHHAPPTPCRVGDEWAMCCPTCGRFVSVRDCCGMTYSVSAAKLRKQRREMMEADAEGREHATGYITSTAPRVYSTERIRQAMRMGVTRKRAAQLLGVGAKQLDHMCKRHGIARPSWWT